MDIDQRLAALTRQMEGLLERDRVRGPSKASKIGQGPPMDDRGIYAGDDKARSPIAKRLRKSIYAKGGNVGELATAFALMGSRDPDDYRAGKAILESLGLGRSDLPEKSSSYSWTRGTRGDVADWSKATLGTTGTTGGYVLPNNLVDTVQKPATQQAVYSDLVTTVGGVSVRGVDMPYRLGAPPRASFQDWGTTKENLNETYGSYTATLGTLARIYDVSKQYLRFSAGAAEQDVMDELTKSMQLAENYYIIAGAGTGSVGVGDPTTGIYTALTAASSFNGYTTAFSSASQSTLLGSFAQAISQAAGALAKRSRDTTAVVVDANTYWEMLAQGTDTAGFWISPGTAPSGFSARENGGISLWGIPIYWDANLGTNAATKIAICGDWKAAKLYRGTEFRIDSSDVAGSRWDENLVGFRGEEEIGFNASTAVNIGAFQLITSAVAT